MRKINEIIIHCSVSEWGDAKIINKWHKERGFSEIGYHFVILNGYPTYNSFKNKKKQKSDGRVEYGRPISKMGAHAKKRNKNSVGICLIGNKDFTVKQMNVLMSLMYELINNHPVGLNIYGHNETEWAKKIKKTCPNMNMSMVRAKFVEYILSQFAPEP